MDLKLGFLTYPITFIANMFGAFTSSSSWCTSGSCTKSFGNFMGSNFTVDLNQMQTTMPTLWAFLLAALRGLTVLALIFGIRKKYMEVIHK
jgi:formate-dependent nitrite reductase membrane component NrfD